MRWLLGAFGVSLATTLVLQVRARRERREFHQWPGFPGDGPMDATGLEQFQAGNYTKAGQVAFRRFLGAWIVTAVLGIVVLYELLG